MVRFLIFQDERPAEPGIRFGPGGEGSRPPAPPAGNKDYCSAPLELLKEPPVSRRGEEVQRVGPSSEVVKTRSGSRSPALVLLSEGELTWQMDPR